MQSRCVSPQRSAGRCAKAAHPLQKVVVRTRGYTGHEGRRATVSSVHRGVQLDTQGARTSVLDLEDFIQHSWATYLPTRRTDEGGDHSSKQCTTIPAAGEGEREEGRLLMVLSLCPVAG